MAKNINDRPFDEATLLKLEIFKECFKEWFPVFIHIQYVERIYIYDFFAGSGADVNGTHGSPLILLDVAKGENLRYCSSVKDNKKKVTFIFNEKEPTKHQKKYNLLISNTEKFIANCCRDNCNDSNCVYDRFCTNKNFKEGFNSMDSRFHAILNNKKYAKFILLDQYGFSQVDEDIFLTLVNSPITDFIFFISSSYIKRFKEHSNTKKYIDTQNIEFDERNARKCHITIAEYFEHLIPPNIEYYINHFTIQKGPNYYGLIFGTNHTLGMEKFLKVCWDRDSKAGESNCNTQADFSDDSLFGFMESNKISNIKDDIQNKIYSGKIKDNISGLKYALKKRCLPKVFSEVVKELEKMNILKRIGAKSYTSSNIHKIKVDSKDYYKLEIIDNSK